MLRPKRIEYVSAFYNVLKRGRARQTIFHDEHYYQAVLDTLAEAHQRFLGLSEFLKPKWLERSMTCCCRAAFMLY